MRQFLVVLLLACSAGCAVTPKQPQDRLSASVVLETPPVVPEELFTPCRPDRPIPKEEYLSLNQMERESYLTIYLVNTLGHLKDCNTQKSTIQSLLKQQASVKEEQRE